MSKPSLRTVRERDLRMSLQDLATCWGISKAQLSLIERGKKEQPGWVELAVKGMLVGNGNPSAHPAKRTDAEHHHACPDCDAQMRDRSDHLTHWFHGQLTNHFTCSGRFSPRHRAFSMGTPFGGQFQRLDRAKNPHTGIEVPIPNRRNKSWYERKYDWVWCDASAGRPDGCGHLCWPAGLYSYAGKTAQIFKCLNKQCEYYGHRLRHRGGNVFTPEHSNKSTLPAFAQHCQHCGGPTVRKGGDDVPVGQIRVVCKNCRTLSYFGEKAKKAVTSPRRGGPLEADPHRPTCSVCRRPMGFQRYFFADYDRLPLPVRDNLGPLPELYDEKAELVRRYVCSEHRTYKFAEYWKLPTGELVWKRRPGRKLRRGFRSIESTAVQTKSAENL